MLKKMDILTAANAQVAEYMAQGYMICWMNGSFGYRFRVDLQKGESFIRVKVDRFYKYSDYVNGLYLQVITIPGADAFEQEDAEVLYYKEFYDLSRFDNEEVFTESYEEKKACAEKVHTRCAARHSSKPEPLPVSAALIRALKKRRGFTNATRNNVIVRRCTDGYAVTMMGRNGACKEEIIRFPKK